MAMTEDGKKIVVWALGVLVLTRNVDNTFTVERLHDNGGGTVGIEYSVSREGIVAGTVNGQGAVWLDGVTSPPTIDPTIAAWNCISPDGTRLYGQTTSGDVIERTIGGADVTLESGTFGTFACVDHCGRTAVVSSDYVFLYKKISGVWTNVGTFGDESGDQEDYPSVTVMSGDGTLGFGCTGGSDQKLFMWDLSQTVTLYSTLLDIPIDAAPGGDVKITGMASDKSVIVGYYVTNELVGSALFWLGSENYSTAHNLDSYLTTQGLANFGFDDGEYSSIDTVVCSAGGSHFVARAGKEPMGRSMYYAAAPTPT